MHINAHGVPMMCPLERGYNMIYSRPDEVPAASTDALAELKAATWCARRLAYESYEALRNWVLPEKRAL